MRQIQTLHFPKKIIAYLESPDIPLHSAILTFFCAVMIRCLIEVMLTAHFDSQTSLTAFGNFLHETISYTSGSLSLILLCYLALRKNIILIAKVILPSYILLLLPLIIDISNLILFNVPIQYGYIGASPPGNMTKLFFTYFGHYNSVSLGMRIEIAIALIGLFFYFFAKSNRILLSSVFTFLSYALIFTYFCMPGILTILGSWTGYRLATWEGVTNTYLLLIFLTGSLVFYFSNKSVANTLANNLRWPRIIHYILMLFLGAALAVTYSNISPSIILNKIDINFIFCIISIIFAALTTIVINDLNDKSIDLISNHSRPLIADTISTSQYKLIGAISFGLSMFYAMMADLMALLVMAAVIANYYIYSAKPLRFKRVTLLSKLIISINSIFILMLGSYLVSHQIVSFPPYIFAIFLIGYTCCANFIDIKDYAGDKKERIKTLPVLLGLPAAKKLLGLSFILTYLSFYFVINNIYFLPFIFFSGLLQTYFINRKNYNEQAVFMVNNLCFAILIIYLFVHVFSPLYRYL